VPNEKNLHRSGFLVEDVSNSQDVLAFFNKITMVDQDPMYAENEKKLAQLIAKFTRDGIPVQLSDLKLINEDLYEEDKKQLDKICFHYFIKRVVKWCIDFPNEFRDRMLPIASIQARILHLIECGIITFQEAFDKDGLYGVLYCDDANVGAHHHSYDHHYQHYHVPHTVQLQELRFAHHNHLTNALTNKHGSSGGVGGNQHHRNHHGLVLSLHQTTSSQYVLPSVALHNKIKHVNALYQKYIVELQPRNFLPTIQFWKEHTTGATVPTYRLLHSELSRMYGGIYDEGTDVEAVCLTYGSADTSLWELLAKIES
jgi:hypothetical protein